MDMKYNVIASMPFLVTVQNTNMKGGCTLLN